MPVSVLHRRLAGLARRHAAAAERHAAAAGVDEGHARRVAFHNTVPEDLRRRVGIALSYPDGDDALHSWAGAPFARWAAPPADFRFPRALVEWLVSPPRGWFLGRSCEGCGLSVPLLATWSGDPAPPGSIVVFPACPACGGVTSFAATCRTEPPT